MWKRRPTGGSKSKASKSAKSQDSAEDHETKCWWTDVAMKLALLKMYLPKYVGGGGW